MTLLADVAWPASWKRAPLWSMFQRIKDVGHPDEQMLSVYRDLGVVRKDDQLDNFNKTALNRDIYQLIEDGWLALNRMKAWQGAVGISTLRGIVSGHYICFRPTHEAEPRFLHYLIRSPVYTAEMQRISRGVRPSQIEIDNDQLRVLGLWLPCLEEQRRIADFLDVETARNDALIAAKQQMLLVLDTLARDFAEQQSLGGAYLDLTSPSPTYLARESGWRVTLLRHLECEVQTGPFGSQLHSEEYVEGGWPVVNPANLRQGVIERIDSMCVSDGKREELARHKLELHDIVFGRRGEMGRAGLVEAEHVGWLCGTGSLRLRVLDARVDPRFLKLQLETTAIRSYLLINSVGSTMDNLNSDIVLGVPLVLPDLETQRAVVAAIQTRRALVSSLTSTLTRQIGLLRERRQALITAAVTGELEI